LCQLMDDRQKELDRYNELVLQVFRSKFPNSQDYGQHEKIDLLHL